MIKTSEYIEKFTEKLRGYGVDTSLYGVPLAVFDGKEGEVWFRKKDNALEIRCYFRIENVDGIETLSYSMHFAPEWRAKDETD